MPANPAPAAAVAAIPENHRWCLRCLGWYAGHYKAIGGGKCEDIDFVCEHRGIPSPDLP